MPNTTRGGGISRKISSPKDRRRLKTILDDLDLPQDISIIVRTAGSQRTKAEIKRDYEYLRRTWDGIRETTLTSMAPALIYEEANVMKRAIRDMYSSDMEEVLVEGEDGYKDAKSFMKSSDAKSMPSGFSSSRMKARRCSSATRQSSSSMRCSTRW